MAFLERIAERSAAGPRQPAVPGATPQAAAPAPIVNPPAPATTAPNGRPPFPGAPGPAMPQGAGLAAPVMPKAAQPKPSSAPATPAPTLPTADPGTTTGAATAPAASFVLQMNRLPTSADLVGLPEGVQVQTPFGAVDGKGNLQLSPEGAQLYRETIVKKRKEFGVYPFAGDPNAPPPPITLGKPYFNPLEGRWGR